MTVLLKVSQHYLTKLSAALGFLDLALPLTAM